MASKRPKVFTVLSEWCENTCKHAILYSARMLLSQCFQSKRVSARKFSQPSAVVQYRRSQCVLRKRWWMEADEVAPGPSAGPNSKRARRAPYSYTRALRNRRIKKQTKRFWREPIRNDGILEKNIRNVNQFSHSLPNLYGFGPPSDKKRCICPWAQIS